MDMGFKTKRLAEKLELRFKVGGYEKETLDLQVIWLIY